MMRYTLIGIISIAMLASCTQLAKIQTIDTDDVYLDPVKDKEAFYPKKETPQPTEAAAKVEEKVIEENNPYYAEKDFNYDDYYDNEYAVRIRRFHNPIFGIGYYDTYYTNNYFYTYNPYQYNTSVYMGYSFWGNGWGYGGYYGNGWANPYCNNWNSPYGAWGNPYCYNGFGFNNWNNPWNNPWSNPWNNTYYGGGWYGGGGYWNNPNYGYYNPYDYNSNAYYYGPRTSSTGGNSSQALLSEGGKLIKDPTNNPGVVHSGDPTNVNRFNAVKSVTTTTTHPKGYTNSTENPGYTPKPNNTYSSTENSPVKTKGNHSPNTGQPGTPVISDSPKTNSPVKTNKPVISEPTVTEPSKPKNKVKEFFSQPSNSNHQETPKTTPSNNNWSSPKLGGGNSTPSSPKSSGGGFKPRK